MISILLLILKYIGIFIIALIGLLLLLLTLILITPIKYKINTNYYNKKLNGTVVITWLLRVLSLYIEINNSKISYIVSLCGIKIINNSNAKKGIKYKDDVKLEETVENINAEKSYNKDSIDTNEIQHSEEIKTKEINNNKSKIKNKTIKEYKKQKSNTKKQKVNKKQRDVDNNSKKKTKKEKKVKDYYNKFNLVKTYLTDSQNKKVIKKILKVLKRMLYKLIPKKIKLILKFGTGDPFITGQLLGLGSCLYLINGADVNLEGDFDNKILEGELFVKGKIRIILFVGTVIRLILDKNILRLIIKEFKKRKK